MPPTADERVVAPVEWTGALRHWRRTLFAVVALPIFAIWQGEDTLPINAFFSAYVIVAVVALSVAFEWQVRGRAGMWRTLGVLEGVSLAAATAYAVVGLLGSSVPLLPPDTEASPPLLKALLDLLVLSLFILAYWALAYVFPYAADDARLRALEADRLHRAAELAQLRAHLEPHFILNTLNAIAGLVSEDPKEARRLLASLGDLLRDSLAGEGDTEQLGEQIEWLRRYGEILESRHRGFLRFSWDIDERTRHVRVPRLLLQPLVENAVNHGALRRGDGGHVRVRAAVTTEHGRDLLVCEVHDNGPGIASADVRTGAKGLALVRSRLESAHAGARLLIEPGHPGTRATVELPIDPPRHGEAV